MLFLSKSGNPSSSGQPGKVGEFLAFIVRAGIQVIIETHCEHLIYKVGYEIYKKRFLKDDVTILYKEGIQNPFIVLGFKEDGKFTRDFPEGFSMRL